MGKLQEFLMERQEAAPGEAQIQINQFPYPFTIHSISERENKALKKSCQKISYDKRTRQKEVETDIDLYNNRLVAACCSDPNFKDAALQEKFGVRGAEDLIDTVLKPGQFIDLLLAVQDINGFSDNMESLREEAKN